MSFILPRMKSEVTKRPSFAKFFQRVYEKPEDLFCMKK